MLLLLGIGLFYICNSVAAVYYNIRGTALFCTDSIHSFASLIKRKLLDKPYRLGISDRVGRHTCHPFETPLDPTRLFKNKVPVLRLMNWFDVILRC